MALLAIAMIILFTSAAAQPALADRDGSATRPSGAAGEVKPPSERSVKKPTPGLAKEAAKPRVGPSERPERDGPLLGLLWLLTGSSKRH